jgi:hypothetical protein
LRQINTLTFNFIGDLELPIKPFIPTIAMLTAFGIVIGNASAADQFCIAQPHALSCDYLPALPDEKPNQPAIPLGLNLPSITANSTVTFSGTGLA